ncbi:hypothetical protein EXU85_20610 [Spirosoma sp. KCTC 42546]|uniref:hypothetical protein n=1 Tax=Spirosoma sp. KCTC 42546 TaxID=2520506 RepID=UPI00115ABF84|nr:hypothetical protein [Spirosoma sp. KCTC 42546]QDK80883.1 hypothetical protein EXU85_20610 [Spirosoma sp. KCTC 42546]
MKQLVTFLFLLPLLVSAQNPLSSPLPAEEIYRFKEPVNMPVLEDAVLRNYTTINANIIAKIPKGTLIELRGKDSGYYRAVYKDMPGFIHFVYIDGDYKTFKSKNYPRVPASQFVSYEDEANNLVQYGKVKLESDLKLEPSMSSKTIYTIPEGSVLKITHHNSSYWAAEINGNKGYLGKTYVIATGKTPEEVEKIAAPAGESEQTVEQVLVETNQYLKSSNSKKTSLRRVSTSSNYYIRGPRGGCYYLTASGRKQYVDRSLCN